MSIKQVVVTPSLALLMVLSLALSFAFPATRAEAQTTVNLNVSATVAAACVIAVNPLSFGNYNPLSTTALQQSTTVQVTCTQGSVASISMGGGNSLSGSQRRMNSSAAAFLNYNIYQPSSATAGAACAFSTAWGNGVTLGPAFVTGPATDLTARAYNVCGEIPVGQNAPAATYNDVVTASITF
jgi:spore coat protein U-like protein